MLLGELFYELETLMRQGKSGEVFLVDRYGGQSGIGEVRHDKVPTTIAEADQGLRSEEVVQLIADEWK